MAWLAWYEYATFVLRRQVGPHRRACYTAIICVYLVGAGQGRRAGWRGTTVLQLAAAAVQRGPIGRSWWRLARTGDLTSK